MRISIVGPTHPYKGGIAQHTTELAHRLSGDGHDVVIQSWKRQYPERMYPGIQRLDHAEFPEFPSVVERLAWNRPDSWVGTGRETRKTADLLIVTMTTPLQAPALELLIRASRGNKKHRPPVHAIVHNVVPHEEGRLDSLLMRRFLRLVDRVVVHSSNERDRALSLGATLVEVVPLPYFFGPVTTRRPERLPMHRVSFVGFVRPYKGLDVLIRALEMSDSRPALEVRGEFWSDPEDVRTAASAANIELTLRADYATPAELLATIDRSDAMILPYRSGTGSVFPRIAFSRRVPVIATRVGDLPDQVIDGESGLLCEPNDPLALAQTIDRLYDGSTLAKLQASVIPPNPDDEWRRYVEGLVPRSTDTYAGSTARSDPGSDESAITPRRKA